MPGLDFVGTTGAPQLPLTPLIYLALAALLFFAAAFGRRRQVLV